MTEKQNSSDTQPALGWYLRRLRSMPLAELPHRVIELINRRTSRFRWRISRDSRLAGHILRSSLPTLPLNLALTRDVAKSEDLDALAEEVDALCAGEITLLSQSWTSGRIVDWSVDPESGSTWPWTRYTFDIKRRHGHGPGDVKFVWELSRLQHLQTLAIASHILDRADASAICLEYLERWLDDNPPYLGLGYACGIELASRVISILVVLTFLNPDTITEELRKKLWGFLATHGRFIARFPSLHSSANNHLVAESAALFILGTVAPTIPEASRWRDIGWQRLVTEAQRQILHDGAGGEQSPTYLAYTLEWLLISRQVAFAGGQPGCAKLDDAIRRGARFISSIADSHGNVPFFGDCDDGVVLRPRLEERNYLSSIVCAIANCVDDAALIHSAFVPDLRSSILTGKNVRNGKCQLASMTFANGGYSVIRRSYKGSEIYLLFDHGPLGFAQTAGHGHADALSIWLHIAGKPVLVDFGTYRYNADVGFRAWARSSAAHNTVEVDGMSQSEMSGPFNWGRRADARLLEYFSDESLARYRGSHSGYVDSCGVVHERTVEVFDSGMVGIVDDLRGDGMHDIRLNFNFAPDLTVTANEAGTSFQIARAGEQIGTLKIHNSELEVHVIRQDSEYKPGPGVVSQGYNQLASACSVVGSGKLALPTEIRSEFLIA